MYRNFLIPVQRALPTGGKYKNIVLGDWVPHGKTKGFVIPLQIKNNDSVTGAINYTFDIYKKALRNVKTVLNEYNQWQKNELFYEIILGHWLQYFIHQAYDKYLTVKAAIETCDENPLSYFVHPSQWIIPLDFNDYLEKIDGDQYAEQQYTQVMDFLDVEGYIVKRDNMLKQMSSIHYQSRQSKNVLRKLMVTFETQICRLNNLLYKNKSTMSLTDTYWPYKRLFSFLFFSRFRYVPMEFDDHEIKIDFTLDLATRNEVVLDLGNAKFEQLLGRTLFKNIPVLFLEAMKPFVTTVKKCWPKKIDVSYTGLGYITTPAFSFFMAEHNENTYRMIHQYGVNFGTDKVLPHEEVEKRISNSFYTWGWGHESNHKSLSSPLNIPYAKLQNTKKIKSSNILIVLTCVPRYLFKIHYQYSSSNFINIYIDEIKRFIETIIPFRKSIVIRPYPYHKKYQWNEIEKIRSSYSDILFDDLKTPFFNSIKKSKICVFGHLATTYIQTLVANKPTIIFINPDIFEHRNEAIPYFSALAEVGILHYSPELAANKLLEVYPDIDKWWNNADVQAAVKKFVDHYGKISKNWKHELDREFQDTLKTFAPHGV